MEAKKKTFTLEREDGLNPFRSRYRQRWGISETKALEEEPGRLQYWGSQGLRK